MRGCFSLTRKYGERFDGRGEEWIPVMGMLDRELRQVRAKVVPNVKRDVLQAEILRQVEK